MKHFTERVAVVIFVFSLITGNAIAQCTTCGAEPKGLFNPFYFRAGLMSGLQIPVSGGVTGQTLGIRTEYGLSKLFSIVGDVQGNKSGNSFSQGQGSLAARYMPFTFNRFQPYVSAGLGAGTSNGRSQGHGHCHHQFQQPVTTTAITQANGETLTPVPTTPTQRHLQGFALIQIGVNFKVNSHFFAHAETTFQTQLSRHPEPGVFAIRAGMSYQFGNN